MIEKGKGMRDAPSSTAMPTRRLAVAGLLSLAGCQTAGNDPLALRATGTFAHLKIWPQPRPVVDFEMLDQTGASLPLQTQLGTVTLVYLWAVWLAPAAKDLPELAALQTLSLIHI